MARVISSFDRYFPVPTISRERRGRPAITSGASRPAEASWILEDNPEMVTALEKMGSRLRKRYRVYDRPV